MNNFFLSLRNKLTMPLRGSPGGRGSNTTEYEGLLLDESDERKFDSLFLLQVTIWSLLLGEISLHFRGFPINLDRDLYRKQTTASQGR